MSLINCPFSYTFLFHFQILREVDAGETTLSNVALSHSGRMLFAGTARGTLWSLKFPLTIPGEWQELQGHGSQIAKVRLFKTNSFKLKLWWGSYSPT